MINQRYLILRKIGEGRSQVFLILDTLTGSNIVLKVLSNKNEESEKKKFRDEYFLLKKLSHPNIIQTYDFGSILDIDENETSNFNIAINDLFITLEYFDSVSLNEILDQIEQDDLSDLIQSISLTLFYLHQSNFAYFDLKPENLLIQKKDGVQKIKFIDFGLSKHLLISDNKDIVGSLKFIAPEILNREKRNHKADLYSFGVLLYRILFKKYPFESADPVEIYKSQIEGEIDIPKTSHSIQFVETIRNLLNANPNDRFETSLNILGNLDINLSDKFNSTWNSAKIFTGRAEILKELHDYIYDESDFKPIRIIGEPGSGKTFLLDEIIYQNINSVSVSKNSSTKNILFVDQLLRSIMVNSYIFPKISAIIKEKIRKFLFFPEERTIQEYSAIFSGIVKSVKFVLLIDDIDNFDPIEIELLSQILPILIINGTKVILAQKTDTLLNENILQNSRGIELKPFIREEVEQFVKMSYAYFLPQSELLEIVLKHSNLQPGNIEKFINNLVHNRILQFSTNKPISLHKILETELFLKESISEIHSHQWSILSDSEIEILNHLSLIRIPLNNTQIKDLIDLSPERIDRSLRTLEKKNILACNPQDAKYYFYSEGNKSFVASKIDDILKYYLRIANWMNSLGNEINITEIAHHYEMACDYENSFRCYYLEIVRARKLSIHHYEIDLLNHLLLLPLNEKNILKVQIDLSEAYFHQGDINLCYSIIEEALNESVSDEERIQLIIRKGIVSIRIGEFQKGIDILESVLPKLSDLQMQNTIFNEIADAYLYLNDFEKTILFCHKVISNDKSETHSLGKAYNLCGLVELYGNSDPKAAIQLLNKSIECYKLANMVHLVSGMMINIGNIHVMMNDYEEGKKMWDEALSFNNSIGNLDQQGKLLLNYGILYYDTCAYENAYEQYMKAKIIFENLGDKTNDCLALINIGEVSYFMCNYVEAIDSLILAQEILEEIKNYTELAEAYFISAKVYYSLSDHVSLQKIVEKYSHMLSQNLFSAILGIKYKLLLALLLILEKKYEEAKELLIQCVNEFSKTNDREDNYNFAFSAFQLVDIQIRTKNYSEAEKILNDEKLSTISDKNSFIEAEKLYWIGKLKYHDKKEDPFQYIESAFSKLESLCVTNLTWRVTYLIGQYFFERGNIAKSENFFRITEAILSNIEESFSKENLINLFNNTEEIKNIRDSIDLFNKKYSQM